MSRRTRDFSTIMEQALITERRSVPSLGLTSRPALPLPRLRPEDEVGILWDRVRERDLHRMHQSQTAQDCMPA